MQSAVCLRIACLWHRGGSLPRFFTRDDSEDTDTSQLRSVAHTTRGEDNQIGVPSNLQHPYSLSGTRRRFRRHPDRLVQRRPNPMHHLPDEIDHARRAPRQR